MATHGPRAASQPTRRVGMLMNRRADYPASRSSGSEPREFLQSLVTIPQELQASAKGI